MTNRERALEFLRSGPALYPTVDALTTEFDLLEAEAIERCAAVVEDERSQHHPRGQCTHYFAIGDCLDRIRALVKP